MDLKISGGLFDFDGVVADSMPAHLGAWSEAYRELFNKAPDKSVIDKQVGRSGKVIAQYLANHAQKPYDYQRLFARKCQLTIENVDAVALLRGTRDMWQSLMRENIPFGIVSNAPRDFIKAVLQRNGLDVEFFLAIEDYNCPKPHPEPYLKGFQKLLLKNRNLRVSEVAVFEDSFHGIKAATGAGMPCFGITSLYSREELKTAGALNSFNDLGQAAKLLFPQ